MGIQTATDPQTGKTVALINGAWEPVSDTATNNVGAKAYLVRDKWVVDETVAEKPTKPSTLDSVLDFGKNLAAGITSTGASILDIPSKVTGIDWLKSELGGAKERADKDSAAYMLGQFADPMAWAIAGGALEKAQAIPKLASIVQRAIGGAAGGGSIAALQGDDPTSSALIGGTAATVLPPVIHRAHTAASNIKSVIRPSPGDIGVKAAADKVDDVIAALRTTKSDVPGVNLSAGQASVPSNSAEFAALQKLVSEDRAPSVFFGPKGIEGQQAAARAAAVRQIGGTPQQLEAAITARTAASNKNFDKAYQNVIKADPELVKISKDPFFKNAMASVDDVVKHENLGPQDLTRILHLVKEQLDAQIQNATKPDATAISKSTLNAILDVKKDIVKWLAKKNPDYDFARVTHQIESVPINQMKAGQVLERALVAPATEVERATSFANAVRNMKTTISKATGKPYIEALTPSQRKVIDAIEADFKRNAEYANLAKHGSGESLTRRIGAPVVPPTGFFEPIVSAGRSWLNRALGTGYEKGLERLAPVMKDPKVLADMMEKATPQQRAIIDAMIGQYMSQGVIVGSQAVKGE